jgi:hypothetical protein
MTERRTEQLPPLRVTPSGQQAIEARRGEWPVSEYMRQALELAIRTGLCGPGAKEPVPGEVADEPHVVAGQHEFKVVKGTFRCGVCGVMQSRHQ